MWAFRLTKTTEELREAGREKTEIGTLKKIANGILSQ